VKSMPRHQTKFRRDLRPYRQRGSRRNREEGLIITLVAVCMLGFVGAMAALSIDLVTLYTARSEAQLAADSAALAGARVLANSGMTSSTDLTLGGNAAALALTVATEVAASNPVGGRNLVSGTTACPAGQEICVSINQTAANFDANPQVTVTVQRTDLPTFFARIWGSTAFTVKASATAEAYNPSNIQATGGPGFPVAPMCVKPWLLPNMSPATSGDQIFNPAITGAIGDPKLLGWPSGGGTVAYLNTACPPTGCSSLASLAPWQYYPGTTNPTGIPAASFPAPSESSCSGCTGLGDYQRSIAGCVQTPISCNAIVQIDQNGNPNRDADTMTAVNILTNATAGGDSVTTLNTPPSGTEPFEFLAGAGNPVVVASGGALNSGADIMVSDSLVTVPVFDPNAATTSFPNVQIIGFVQLFLNPTGTAATAGKIQTEVINIVGCGDGTGEATGTPIVGNGASPVAVRLISP